MAFQSQLRLFVLKYGYVEDTSLYRLEKGIFEEYEFYFLFPIFMSLFYQNNQ